MFSLEKLKILTRLQKFPNNVGDLGKLIVAKGFKKIAQSPINRTIWLHCSETTHCRGKSHCTAGLQDLTKHDAILF